MRCPTLAELPSPLPGKTGWPWTEESRQLPDIVTGEIPWPKVSIVTPSYNQGRFLEEAIRSVLLQGYPDLELIIIDGGSTDESIEVLKKYERWLAYWVSEHDRGQSHAINKGLERSTGELFNWQNADDVLTPNSLATMAEVMVQYPEVSYAHGYRIVVDADSKVLYDTKHVLGGKIAFVPELTSSISNLKGGVQLGCLMRRNLVVAVGGIDENLHYLMDRDVTLRLALRQPPIYVPLPVIFWRAHPEAKTLTWNATRAKERLIMARKIFEFHDLPASIYSLRRTVFATAHRFAWECYIKAGMNVHAVWHIVLDIRWMPFYEWNKRRRVVKNLLNERPCFWGRSMLFGMNGIERVLAFIRKYAH